MKPQKCPDNVYEVMLKCWAANPEDRPTFSELHQMIKNIKISISDPKENPSSSVIVDNKHDAYRYAYEE